MALFGIRKPMSRGAMSPRSVLGNTATKAPAVKFGAVPNPSPAQILADNDSLGTDEQLYDYGQDDSYSGQSVAGSGVTGAGGSAAKPTSKPKSNLSYGVTGPLYKYDPVSKTNTAGSGLAQGQTLQNADAGSRRLDNSQVAWDKYAGIQTWLGNPGDPQYAAKAAYLKSQGLMPSYNGMNLDAWTRLSSTPGAATLGGPAAHYAAGGSNIAYGRDSLGNSANVPGGPDNIHNDGMAQSDAYYQGVQPGRHAMQLRDKNAPGGMREAWGSIVNGKWVEDNLGPTGRGAQTFDPVSRSWGALGGSGAMQGGALGGGGMGAFGSGGGPQGDDYGAGEALRGLIAQGGVLSPSESQALRAQQQGAVARGTNSALEAARLDALRRGDFSGSTLSDTEAKIRRGGNAEAVRSGAQFDAGIRRENRDALMGAIGGATNLYGTNLNALTEQQKLALMLGQLEAQAGGIGSGLNVVLGMK